MIAAQWMCQSGSVSRILTLLALVLAPSVRADLQDVERAQQQAQNAFIQHFLEFTKDKNVMGRAKTPDGKTVSVDKKRKFDRDGGGFLPFQSDLTYHDFSYNATDPNQQDNANKNDKNGKNEERLPRLFAFVSHHGGVSAAGGSSLLERTAYQLHLQFSKEDEQTAAKRDQEEGIQNRSIFRIETREVFKNEEAKNNNEEPDKVERITMRDEARQEIENVGEQSFETIRKAGRGPGQEEDETVMPNGVLLRYAAGSATQAWWNSTLANLSQRRVNRGINPGLLPDSPRLSEGVATCDEWAQAIQGAIQEASEQERERFQQEIQQKVEQCRQMARVPYNEINPRFRRTDDGKGEQLETGDLQKEDAFQRDLRNQLEVLAKAGTDVGSLQSNWQYDPNQDGKNRVTIEFDDNGQPLGEQQRSVTEQLESYNQQLQAAAEGMEQVRERFPDMPDLGNPLDYQIAPNTRSVMDINATPVVSAFEEANIPEIQGPITPASNYDQLLGQGQ